jgi:hypothetical protein
VTHLDLLDRPRSAAGQNQCGDARGDDPDTESHLLHENSPYRGTPAGPLDAVEVSLRFGRSAHDTPRLCPIRPFLPLLLTSRQKVRFPRNPRVGCQRPIRPHGPQQCRIGGRRVQAEPRSVVRDSRGACSPHRGLRPSYIGRRSHPQAPGNACGARPAGSGDRVDGDRVKGSRSARPGRGRLRRS